MSQRPNVLFILADQHNAKCLGHQGHLDVQTPNLDRLAAEGTRFDNAITQNPICTPSRMCFLSGQYCHNHGYYGLSGANPDGLPTVLGHFRRHGYRTAAIGKIHCPEYWVEDDCDVFHETCECSIGGRSAAYTEFLRQHDALDKEDHGALIEFGKEGTQKVDGRPSFVSYEVGQEGWVAATGIAFMQECRDAGQPFFLHASLPKPHQCYTPAREFWDLYETDKLTLPPNVEYEMQGKAPNMIASARGWRENQGWIMFAPKTFEAGRRRKLHGYLGSVSHVDHAVGQLVDWLDANGLAENTIVIYSSDHGDYACEHGIMEKAPGISSDAITRIPYIWRCPGRVAAGHVATELVETVDVSRTLCGLADLPVLETSDGKDIAHLLRGEAGEVRDVAVTEFAWSKSVRKGKWRFVYHPPEQFAADYLNGFGELYDLEADPWEMTNLWHDPAYTDVVRELRGDLLDWLVTTTRPATVLGVNRTLDPADPQHVHRYHNTTCRDGKIGPDHIRRAAFGNYL